MVSSSSLYKDNPSNFLCRLPWEKGREKPKVIIKPKAFFPTESWQRLTEMEHTLYDAYKHSYNFKNRKVRNEMGWVPSSRLNSPWSKTWRESSLQNKKKKSISPSSLVHLSCPSLLRWRGKRVEGERQQEKSSQNGHSVDKKITDPKEMITMMTTTPEKMRRCDSTTEMSITDTWVNHLAFHSTKIQTLQCS